VKDQLPLKPLHGGLVGSKLIQLNRLTTEQLLLTLKPGNPHCLKTRQDGTILDGHHRIHILRERGIAVDELLREIIARNEEQE
jgi:hypothetical protein